MDNEMIERCSQALSTAIENFRDTHKPGEVFEAPDMVLAIIKAMREPTDKMVSAGMDGDSLEVGSSAYGCWQDMIDSVIGDK